MTEKTVDGYIEQHPEWAEVLNQLRAVVTDAGLDETVKWGAPVYVLDGRNVVGMGAFNSYAGLWFFDGAMLSDPDQVLINAQQGKTRGMRQWRFQSGEQPDAEQVRRYVDEAMANARAGRTLKPRRDKALIVPPLLQAELDDDPALRKAFAALAPGRQRDYARYIEEPSRDATRQRRLDKILPMITRGEGLNDRYRDC